MPICKILAFKPAERATCMLSLPLIFSTSSLVNLLALTVRKNPLCFQNKVLFAAIAVSFC